MGAAIVATTLALSAGCSHSAQDEVSSRCGYVAGKWSVTSTPTASTCPNVETSEEKLVFTMVKRGDTYFRTFDGRDEGCPGTFDIANCRFDATCEGYDAEGNSAGTFQFSTIFDKSDTVAGTTTVTVGPPTLPSECTFTYSENGSLL